MNKNIFLKIGYYLASCTAIMDMFTSQVKPNAYEIIGFEWNPSDSAMYKHRFIFRGPGVEDTMFDKVRVKAPFGNQGVPTYLRVFEDENGKQYMQQSFQKADGKQCLKILNSTKPKNCPGPGTFHMTSKDGYMFVPHDVSTAIQLNNVVQQLSLNGVYEGVIAAHEVRIGVEMTSKRILFYRDKGEGKECKQVSYKHGSITNEEPEECTPLDEIKLVGNKSTLVSLALLKAVEYLNIVTPQDKCTLPITQLSILQNTYVRFLYEDHSQISKDKEETDDTILIYVIVGITTGILVIIAIIGLIVFFVFCKKKKQKSEKEEPVVAPKNPEKPKDTKILPEKEEPVEAPKKPEKPKSSKKKAKTAKKKEKEEDKSDKEVTPKSTSKSTSSKLADPKKYSSKDFEKLSEVSAKGNDDESTDKKDFETPSEIKPTPKKKSKKSKKSKKRESKRKEPKKSSKKKKKQTPPALHQADVGDNKDDDYILAKDELSFKSLSEKPRKSSQQNKKKPSSRNRRKNLPTPPKESDNSEDMHETIIQIGPKTKAKRGKAQSLPDALQSKAKTSSKDHNKGRENFQRLMKEAERKAGQPDEFDETTSRNSDDISRG